MNSMSQDETQPLVEILMTVYNGEQFLAEQIESILCQTYTNWRLIISDDCSTDASLEIAQSFAASDSRIQIHESGRRFGSAGPHFMHLLHVASADYVMFCDQDDVWLPQKIEMTLEEVREVEATVQSGTPVLVFTDMKVVNENLEVISDSFEAYSNVDPSRTRFEQVLAQSVGAGCTMMMNGVLVSELQRTPEDAFVFLHDRWVSLVAAEFGRIRYVNAPTNLYRQHFANSVGAKKFSVLAMLADLSDKRCNVYASAHMAQTLLAVYGSDMSDVDRASAEHYAAITHAKNAVGRIYHQCRSGVWKQGVRKLGQVACLVSGPGKGAY